MSPDQSIALRLPHQCPQCGQLARVNLRTSVKAQTVVLKWCCAACSYEWLVYGQDEVRLSRRAGIRDVADFREEARYRRGHGSLMQGDAVALDHVGYEIVERRNSANSTGHIRGDAKALRWLGSTGRELLLVLDNGKRLPIVLTHARGDDLTWEFDSSEKAHW